MTSALSQFTFRLVKIDVDTLEVTVAFELPDGAQGIAFGPAPEVEVYCSSKPNSAGCLPAIDWTGHPSAWAHIGFEVTATNVRNQSPGFLVVGLNGRASMPFHGGTACVAGPWMFALPVDAGGSAPPVVDCTGTWTTDLNTWLYQNLPLRAGTELACQWWGRDPGLSGPDAAQLSDGLLLTLLP